MQVGRLHVRKRFLGTLLAVGLVGSGHASALAEYLPELPPLEPLRFVAAPAEPLTTYAIAADDDVEPLKAAIAERNIALIEESRTYVAADGELITADRIEQFLLDKGSPLAPWADAFVEAGRANDVDPRVVVAIAGIESSFGKRQRGNNAWGWGGGPGGSLSRWADWPTAIHAYTERLGARYDTSTIDEAFARRYVPPNWRHWLSAVHQFMGEI